MHEHVCKFQRYLSFEVDGRLRQFGLFAGLCAAPECMTFHLSMYELDETGRPLVPKAEYLFHIDARTWTGFKVSGGTGADRDAVGAAFFERCPEDTRAWLQDLHRRSVDEKQAARAYVLDDEEVASRDSVSWSDVASGRDGIFRGGETCSFRFERDGEEYLVEDMYCAIPECECDKAEIAVCRVVTNDEGLVRPELIGVGVLSLRDGRFRATDVEGGWTKRRFRNLVEDWLAEGHVPSDTFSRRYELIKSIGERCLPLDDEDEDGSEGGAGASAGDANTRQVRRPDKVGRNDPCPCGSGKKYKKCCLRDEGQA